MRSCVLQTVDQSTYDRDRHSRYVKRNTLQWEHRQADIQSRQTSILAKR